MTINKEQAVSDAMIEAGKVVYHQVWNTADSDDKTRLAVKQIYLAMKATSHPLEQQQAVSGDVVEQVARALVDPLGYPPEVDWERTWVGNQCDDTETGSLAYLCRALARSALTASGVGRMREALEEMLPLFQEFRDSIVESHTCPVNDMTTLDPEVAPEIEAMDGVLAKARTALQEEGVERRD